MGRLEPGICRAFKIALDRNWSCKALAQLVRGNTGITAHNLQGAKFYQMDDGRWLILDYLNIPDAPRHYIDCIEGDICNMNVRIISDGTKKEIEKNQEIFE